MLASKEEPKERDPRNLIEWKLDCSVFVCKDKKNLHLREVVIDELTIAKDPDCAKSDGREECYPKQSFKPESIHIHPQWFSRRATVCLFCHTIPKFKDWVSTYTLGLGSGSCWILLTITSDTYWLVRKMSCFAKHQPCSRNQAELSRNLATFLSLNPVYKWAEIYSSQQDRFSALKVKTR